MMLIIENPHYMLGISKLSVNYVGSYVQSLQCDFDKQNDIASKVMNSALQTLGLYVMNIEKRNRPICTTTPHTCLRPSREVFF